MSTTKIKRVRIVQQQETHKGIFIQALVWVDVLDLDAMLDKVQNPKWTNSISNALREWFGEEGVEEVVVELARVRAEEPRNLLIEPEYRVVPTPASVWSINNRSAGNVLLQALVIEE